MCKKTWGCLVVKYPINEIYQELLASRDFLINELGITYEKDELLKLSGRLIELNKVIKIIEEVEGA
jgi:hypothetical protein